MNRQVNVALGWTMKCLGVALLFIAMVAVGTNTVKATAKKEVAQCNNGCRDRDAGICSRATSGCTKEKSNECDNAYCDYILGEEKCRCFN